jgi:hypothetical protein
VTIWLYLELVGGPLAKVVYLNASGLRWVDRQLYPVWHTGILLLIPESTNTSQFTSCSSPVLRIQIPDPGSGAFLPPGFGIRDPDPG